MLVFVAIFWREDYRGGRNAVTHDCRSNTVKCFHDLATAQRFAEQTLRTLAAEPPHVRVTKEGQALADRVSGMLGGQPGPGGWIKGGGRW